MDFRLPITAALLYCLAGVISGTLTLTRGEVGVIALDEEGNSPTWRVRRQATMASSAGFSNDQKMAILERHNELRSTRRASDMMKMDWDAELERSAQAWADRCIFQHSSRTARASIPGYSYAGENLYAGQGTLDPESVVQMWFDEWSDYNYDRLYCTPGKMCGHYTQVVWSTSRAVGCGVRFCPSLAQVTFRNAFNVVCHYGPGGNIIGYKPFKKGAACSECPEDAKFCVSGLCYHSQGGNSSRRLSGSLWAAVAVLVTVLHILERISSPL